MFKQIAHETRQNNLVLSPSSIITYLKSPAQYQWQYILGNKSEQTPAMFEGEVIHKAILEPDTFDSVYTVAEERHTFLQTIEEIKGAIEATGATPVKGKKPDLIAQLLGLDPTARVWDVYLSGLEASERRVIPRPLHNACLEIKKRVEGHPWLFKALQGGRVEEWAHVQFSENVYLNMRMDYYNDLHKQPIILDVKTTRNASFESFQKDVWNYSMYVSAAIYVDTVEKLTGRTPLFAWVVVEKEAPYPVEVYSADFGLLEAGRAVYRKTIDNLIDSVNKNEFSYNKNKIVSLNLPAWAFNKLDAYAESETP